jgi:HlyD family secretion protein
VKTLMRVLRMGRRVGIVLAVMTLLGGAAWGVYTWQWGGENGPQFRTERITRGRMAALINATGTVAPEEVIDVGAQVAGQIIEFGPDLDDSKKKIDYCSRVEKGTLLALIDKSLYEHDVILAEADLAVARADVEKSAADLESLKASLEKANKDHQRALRAPAAVAPTDLDMFHNAYLIARAAVPAGMATLKKAEKLVARAEKALARAKTNLGYTEIRSPVKGVIVDRRVNIGQTVVASLNAPSLFLLATDLKKVDVLAQVNEADIGRIEPGQTVYFKVDAYPQDVFTGVVYQIRHNAGMTQNVVTYTVVVKTNNDNLRLKPYLTANMQFHVDERNDALMVPNSALRYRPALERVHPDFRQVHEQPRKKVATEYRPAGKEKHETQGTVWVESEGFVKPITVAIGLTDGASTEILPTKDELPEGTPVVTGETSTRKGGSTNNPFAVKLYGGKKS